MSFTCAFICSKLVSHDRISWIYQSVTWLYLEFIVDLLQYLIPDHNILALFHCCDGCCGTIVTVVRLLVCCAWRWYNSCSTVSLWRLYGHIKQLDACESLLGTAVTCGFVRPFDVVSRLKSKRRIILIKLYVYCVLSKVCKMRCMSTPSKLSAQKRSSLSYFTWTVRRLVLLLQLIWRL